MMEAREALQTNEKNVPTLLILASKDKNVPLDVTRTIKVGLRVCDNVEDLRILDYCAKRRAAETLKSKAVECV
jgi:hypothetical protein